MRAHEIKQVNRSAAPVFAGTCASRAVVLVHVALGLGLLAACQSGPGQRGGGSGPKPTVDLQVSSDKESLLAVRKPEAAIKVRSELGTSEAPAASDALLLTLAELSLLGNDLGKAREMARIRLKSNFNDIDAMNVLVRASLAEGKLSEAKLLIDNAQAIDARQATTWNLRGLFHYQSGQLVEAREAWKQTLKYDPTHVAAMMNLGALYFANRNVDQAGVLFERILAQKPDHLDAKVGFALVRHAQGQSEQSKAILEKIADADDASPLVFYNLAVIERDGFQNFAAALEHMEKFVSAAARIPTARKSLENGLQIVSQLRTRMAAEKQKLSDAQLREMAAAPVVAPVSDSTLSDASPTASTVGTARQSDPSSDGASDGSVDRDVKSLEDAIK
jgi:tetratricopeptide (TPR) repeat protein